MYVLVLAHDITDYWLRFLKSEAVGVWLTPGQRVTDHVAKFRLCPLGIYNLSPKAGGFKPDN